MRLYAMCEAIDSCPAPVVARVQGHALGGGSGLLACVDVAVAAEDAVFGFSEVRLGIMPAVISPFVLPRIGPGAARRWFLTGERSTRPPLFASGSSTTSRPTSTRPSTASSSPPRGGPDSGSRGESLAREQPGVPRPPSIGRCTADERGGPGRASRLPREAGAPWWKSESSS